MKHLRPATFVIFAVVCLSGVMLLYTSQSVQNAQDRQAALESSIAREQEKIRMLRAEWEYLNRPERLETLAKEFLDMMPPDSEYFVESEDVPSIQEETADVQIEKAPQVEPAVYTPIVKPTAKPPVPVQKAPPAPPKKIPEKITEPSKPAKNFQDLLDNLGAPAQGEGSP